MRYRLGIDLGGTKTEVGVLDPAGAFVWRERVATPRGYDDIVANMAALVMAAEAATGARASIGVGIPGVISPATGKVKNANTQVLNGRALDRDLSAALGGRAVRAENDANCFALSEASDGAGQGARCVFGVIMGTGCGGGVVVDGAVLAGRHRIAGEWGHTPLPWPLEDEWPPPACWCGKRGCLELYLCGPGLAASAGAPDVQTVCARAAAGDERAVVALERHADRLARGLAVVCNLIDPDVIVLGGGLSHLTHLYQRVSLLLPRLVFSDVFTTQVVCNRHGDSGGVRGAAWLWPPEIGRSDAEPEFAPLR